MMKRLILLMTLLCVPLTSMAMKPMDDKSLDQISGQAGVSIMVDVTMNIHFDTIAWGDSDGLGSTWGVTTQGGYVGVTTLTVSGLTIAPRVYSLSPNSVSFWPDSESVSFLNGVPYRVVNVGSGIN
jgi:hypothetical protein